MLEFFFFFLSPLAIGTRVDNRRNIWDEIYRVRVRKKKKCKKNRFLFFFFSG